MESLCPTCNSVIDPQRAPVARIRGARVVTFCSAACAEGRAPAAAESGAAASAEFSSKGGKGARGGSSGKKQGERKKPTKTKKPAARTQSAAQSAIAANSDATPADNAASDTADEPAVMPEPTVSVAPPPKSSKPQKKRPGWQPSPQAVVPAGESEPLGNPTVAAAFGSGRRNRVVIGLASAVLLGGAALLALDAWPGGDDRTDSVEGVSVNALADRDDRPPVVAAITAEAAEATNADAVKRDAIDPKKLYDRAVTSLNQLLESSSLRLQRVSAMALARTGDAKAIARLGELLEIESSPLVKVQIGYALARAGDARGRKVLMASLSRKQRDVKLDAARSLVRLGDDGGADRLRGMLSYRHYKIGAAGLLARLGDKKGFATLRAARKGPRSSHEIKMRALVALGRAGDATVRDDLVAILADGRYQVGAAGALAALGDKAAIPALAKQLDIDVFRVQAALSLRRLGADVDLAPLAAALHAGNDVVRVTAAEAILVLTGSITLSERD